MAELPEENHPAVHDDATGGSHDSTTLASPESSNDAEKSWEPIREGRRFSRRNSEGASLRSLSRVLSHNGYACDGVNEDEESLAAVTNAQDSFVVGWEGGDKDPKNPRSMSLAMKWFTVLIMSNAALCVTATSSIYTSTYAQTIPEFHSDRIVATLGLSLFVFGLGCGPMLLGPLSEFYGRRPIYLVSYAFFVIWLIPSAVAKNMATMLVARFFDGFAGSAFLSVSGGSVGDMFTRETLQAPMLIFTAAPFLGPSIGPLIGGFINEYTNWRWTYYVLLIWGGVLYLFIIFVVPETYHPVLLRNKARKIRKETGDERFKAPMELTNKSIPQTLKLSLIRPFQLLTLEFMVSSLSLFSAILLGIIYLFFGAFPLILRNNHDFTLSQIGLSFLGLFAGFSIGIMTDPIWHKNYSRLVKNRELATGEKGCSEPEYRLPPAIAGAILVPIGLFMFGWTTYRKVHWIVPIIGSGIFGVGTLLIFSGIFTFLVEAYPLYAASALAANTFARCSFAAVFPLFGVQMYEKLGYQWATTLLAFLTVAMMPFPYIFYKYGKKLRGRSRFA